MRNVSRRAFLQVGTAGLLGWGLSDWLALEARANDQSAKPTAKATGMILIWLDGGPSSIDTWDPKPAAPTEIRGEFDTIETALPGVRLTEPLARTANVLDRCVLVRSLSHGLPAHGPGTQYVMTGNLPSPAREHPSLGSMTARAIPSRHGMPPYVTLGRTTGDKAGYLGAAWNPFEVTPNPAPSKQPLLGVSLPKSVPVAEFDRRTQLRELFDQHFQTRDSHTVARGMAGFQEQAVEILRSDRIGRAFDLNEETQAARDLYGRSTLAENALRARRLIEAGARFVTITLSGFDTHADNFSTLRNRLLPPVDQSLSALVTDLDQRGLLETTLLCCLGEFSRTPRVNGQAGRDHWSRSTSAFLAGGGLKRGHVHGATDKRGEAPATEPHSPDDLAATLLYCLTGSRELSFAVSSGRSVRAVPNGTVIESLIA